MRLGFWSPVYGNWIASARTDEFDASFDHAKRTALLAEQIGFDTLLIAEHYINPLGPDLDQLDCWTTAAALAALTSRIEIIAAVKPGLRPPGIVAKMAANIAQISNSRFAINLIAAWWMREFEMLGLPTLDHDERYARMEEFLAVILGLWRTPNFSFNGHYHSAANATIAPRPHPRPPLYFGGDSEAGRDFGARHADIFLMNGRSIEEAAATVRDISRRAEAANRAPPRFGVAAFVCCRADEATTLEEANRLANLKTILRVSGDSTMSHQTNARDDADLARDLGTNNGWACGLYGSPDHIAARMRAYEAVGIETFLLQFHPLASEMERFGEQVMPLLR